MEAHVCCTRVWREYGTRVNIPSEERETDTLNYQKSASQAINKTSRFTDVRAGTERRVSNKLAS